MKNIYLFSSLYETVPQFTAHSHAEVAKFCAQQRNQLKIAEYRRTGDKRMKKGLVYTILSEFKEGKPHQRASSNLEYTTHLQYDIDYLNGKTPEEMAEHIVCKLDAVNPRLRDHIYIEHSPTQGRLHCILLRIGDGTVRQEMLRYSKFFAIDADLCVNDTARFMSVTCESLCGTTLDNVLRDIDTDLLTKLQTALGAIPAPAAAASTPARPIVAAKSSSANPELIELVRDHLINAMGGVPQEGERNLFCYKFAAEFYSLAGNAPETIIGLLEEPYSYFGLSREECERTVKSALHKKELDGSYERSQLLRDALDAAMRCHGIPPVILSQGQQSHEILSPQSSDGLSSVETEPVVEEVAAVEPTAVEETPAVEPAVVDEPVAETPVAEHSFDPFSETPPQIEYSQLPGFLKVLLKGMPMKVVPHCINMLEPCAATYLLDAHTTDIVGQKLWLGSGWLNFTVAPMSSGKGSKTIPMAALKRKLIERDLASRREQEEWLKIAKTCKSGDLPHRPPHRTNLVAASVTNAGMLQKLKCCEEGALFCECDEIMSLANFSSEPHLFPLLAFNRERYECDRSSSESEVGSVEMKLSISACGTGFSADQYFKNCWLNGLITRCSYSTIVTSSDDTFDDDFEYKSNIDEEKLAMYIQRLENANLELKCPKANEFAKRMRRMLQEIGSQYDSEPIKILARRQAIILQKQCYLYWILEGQKWTKKLEAFLEWRFKYAIWALWHCVGHIIEQEHNKEQEATAKQKKSGPVNWLEFLPESFGISELTQLRVLKGASTDSKLLTKQISNWKARNLIKNSDTPGKYINLKFKKTS